MIAASEIQEFVPYGRQQVRRHPGAVVTPTAPPDTSLLHRFSQVNIQDEKPPTNEWWMLRGDSTVEEEELYVCDKTAVWSRGMAGRSFANSADDLSAGRQLRTCYTTETPIKQAMWCNFSKIQRNRLVPMPSICLLDGTKINVFTTDGEDFLSALQFKVSSAWATKFGLLLERLTPQTTVDSKCDFSQTYPAVSSDYLAAQHLPTVFSLLHPLDEIAPIVVNKQGGCLAYMNDTYQKVVFTSEEPSLCMLYDMRSGQHSVWKIRRATPEESHAMCSGQDTTNTTQTTQPTTGLLMDVSNNSFIYQRAGTGFLANRTINNSTQQSPLNGNSIVAGGTSATLPARTESPLAALGNTFKFINQTPGNMTPGQVQTPTPPGSWDLPAGTRRIKTLAAEFTSPSSPSAIDARLGTSQSVMDGAQDPRPIVPELCFDYIWSENLALACYHEGESSPASRVFLGTDLLGQAFLFYVVPTRSKLFCIRLSWTNQGELILGSVSTLPAKDAVYLPALEMTAVLEPAGGVLLYTGTALIGKLHVAGINTALASSSYFSSSSAMIAQFSMHNSPVQRRTSILSSTVVGEAAFDDQVHLLSPVNTSAREQFDFGTPPGTAVHSTPRDAHLQALRDPVANRLTLEFLNGSMFRITLPDVCSTPLVSRCLKALKTVLPKEAALHLLVKWCGARNAPGTQDFSPAQEWQLFVSLLLGLLGYDVEKLSGMKENVTTIPETPSQILRKKRASDCGSQDDWEYLLGSHHHESVKEELGSLLGMSEIQSQHAESSPSTAADGSSKATGSMDVSAMLFSSAHLILFSLHLIYEDLKLDTMLADTLPLLVRLLHQLATDLRMPRYVEYYWRDFPCRVSLPSVPTESQMSDENFQMLSAPAYMPESPPSVMSHVYHLLQEHGHLTQPPYPVMENLNTRSKDIVQLIGLLCCANIDNLEKLVRVTFPHCQTVGGLGKPATKTTPLIFTKVNSYNHVERVVFYLAALGYTGRELSSFPAGIGLVLCDAIHRVRENPPTDWPEPVFKLIGRQDLAASPPASVPAIYIDRTHCNPAPPPAVTRSNPENDDGMESMDREILKLRFSSDHRVTEVRNLLQSSHPVTIAITQRPDVSDHEFIEEQEKHLYAICTRTMALPLGRGMLTLHTSCPVASEPLPVPRLCLTGRAPPRGTTVDLSHIEVVPNMNLWPLFHNGVAAGLRISPSATNIDSAWILYNKPKGGPEVLPEHAGFLMALGLNGHLKNLAELNTYKYLSRCYEMTSVGLLLGIAATNRGTMDVQTTKVLSVHIESLLPPTSIELDIVQNIQVAALLGVGLVYQKTVHRHIAEVLLSEIGRPPGPEMENSLDRESYSLAAGLALGMVVLGTGSSSTGLADLGIADTLHYYMVGGHKRPLTGSQKEKYKSPSYQIREGNDVNIDVTAPGATLALGMMFFNSGNEAVANWMKAPETQFLLDFVCPDLLLLRMVARGLILWDNILPTAEWVHSHVPAAVKPYCLLKPRHGTLPDNIDYETMNQVFCNITAGACMAMGLRFAGSANNQACTTLLTYCKMFTSMVGKSIAELAGKSTIETCLNVILLSLAMVMAGTGDLNVMRLCRYLRSRVGQATNSVVTYGSHLATHMALGLLFLGGGRYTLCTSPESVAAMLCAFFPKFPTHSNDNRYHLQAFRHLYVLAAKPRLLLPRDIDTGILCYAHLTFIYLDTKHYKNQKAWLKAPCLLPELHLLKEVRVEDDRYWSIVFRRTQNWDQLEDILNGTGYLGVKQRAGCLSYLEDPHGFRSLLAQTLTSDKAVSWSVPAESIFAFSSEPSIVNFAHFFLEQNDKSILASTNESEQLQFLTKLVFDCVTRDKMTMLPIWLTVIKALQMLVSSPISACQSIWQLKLMVGYALKPPPALPSQMNPTDDRHHNSGTRPSFSAEPLVSPDLALSIKQKICRILDSWQRNDIGKFLTSYMRTGKVSATDEGMAKLAVYLKFHNIPSPLVMSQILAVGDSVVNPISVIMKLTSHQNNMQENHCNHLALLLRDTTTE